MAPNLAAATFLLSSLNRIRGFGSINTELDLILDSRRRIQWSPPRRY
jgi:hypothetical protein